MVLKIRRSFFGLLNWGLIRDSSKRVKVALLFIFLAAVALSIGIAKINTVTAAACPCHVFTTDPSPSSFNDAGGVEVGFKFKSDMAGYISGVRFYKNIAMTGTHTASLWNNMGQRIAQASFTSETATGWQEVNFAPVAVTANTIYTASVYMSDGNYAATTNYFTSDIVNTPLTVPRDTTATDGFGNAKNGVYNVSTSSAYPTNSFNAGNYWVDVTYIETLSNDPPVVTSTDPASSQTSVFPGTSVTATFDLILNSSSVTSSTFLVKDSNGTAVPGTISYNSTTKQAKFISDVPLTVGMTYTATLKGGSGTVIKSLDGVALASDYTWSFTTTVHDPCPCSLKNNVAPQGSVTFNEGIPLELATKIVPKSNGYISKLRFYKPILSQDTTNTGNIWDNQGSKLATVDFTNETEYGWQDATLSSPLHVNQGQLYVVSYGTQSGTYQSTVGGLNTDITSTGLIAYANNNPLNAAAGSGNNNGSFKATIGQYPNSGSTSGTYYWIDAVFSTSTAVADPLSVTSTQPKSNAYGIKASQRFEANFNKALNAASVNSTNVKIFNKAGTQVAGTPGYNSDLHQITFLPTGGSWTANETYTVHLSTAIAGIDATTLGNEYVATFSVGNTPITDINSGQGGPVLVITSSTNAYDSYYAEILRTEGITYFDVKDISTINASVLAGYKSVILGEMSLTQPQVDLLSSWVSEGGDLVSMRPDKKLAGLLGLQDANSSRTNQYITVDTGSAPGKGIVSNSIQFKGQADNYTANTARVVATLYSDATTATFNPAVTTRAVGSKGGSAMAFTYDLAKSVTMLHQGNQAWAGQDRDGDSTVRGSDLFYGNKVGDAQPDWVDPNKMQIPQADEQQRLLVNMLSEASKNNQPMPRFWYLPHDDKAALVFAGDDHDVGAAAGTEVHLNRWLNESTTNCSVLDWECVRASHYIYYDVPMSNARAVEYSQLGFEIGDHPSNTGSCNNFTSYANLSATYASDLALFRSTFPGLPNQTTDRFHCYVWSDWDSMAKVSRANGIRYTLDYVAYPLAWVNGKSPLMTGSGMNMRLTDASGGMLDTYQGVTNFDNTAANLTSINAAFDNALGSSGYYGIFGSHYDMSDSYDQTLFDAARAHNIPLISSHQALDWLDGRDSSEFTNLQSTSKGETTFTLKPGQGATGLRAMMPMSDGAGSLTNITSGADSVAYDTKTIKGIDYAVFDAAPGDYMVKYSDYNPNPPATTPVTPPDATTKDNGSSQSSSQGAGGNTNDHKSSANGLDEEAAEDAITTPDKTKTAEPSDGHASSNDSTGEKSTDEQIATSGWPWRIWVLLGLLLLSILWFGIARRHRKKKDLS